MFIDESGIYLLPGVVSTWAPRGETPVLHQHLTNDHLSVISAITPDGALYFHIQRKAYDSQDVIRFLEALHEELPGKLLVIWDNAPIHKSKDIQRYMKEGANLWLRLERLPGYAPELNPDDGIWRYLKYVALKNVCAATIALLEGLVRGTLEKIKELPHIIKSTFKEAGLA